MGAKLNSMRRSIVQSNNQPEKNCSHQDCSNPSLPLPDHEPKIAPISSIVFDDSDKNTCGAEIKPSGNDSALVNKQSETDVHTEGPRYTFSTEIPETYDDPYLCILPKTPDNYYVYWENVNCKSEKSQTANPDEQWLLRIKELTCNDTDQGKLSYFNLPVDIKANNDSYINFPRPLSPVGFELGKISPQGQFEVVVSMNDTPIQNPQDSDFNSSSELHHWYDDENTDDKNAIRISKINTGFTDRKKPVTTDPDSRYFGSASPF